MIIIQFFKKLLFMRNWLMLSAQFLEIFGICYFFIPVLQKKQDAQQIQITYFGEMIHLFFGLFYYFKQLHFQLALLVLLFYLRFSNLDAAHQNLFSMIAGILILLLALAVIYLWIKAQKKQYYRFYQQQQDIIGWKMLLEYSMPYPVIVLTPEQTENNSQLHKNQPAENNVFQGQQDQEIKFSCQPQFDVKFTNLKCRQELVLNQTETIYEVLKQLQTKDTSLPMAASQIEQNVQLYQNDAINDGNEYPEEHIIQQEQNSKYIQFIDILLNNFKENSYNNSTNQEISALALKVHKKDNQNSKFIDQSSAMQSFYPRHERTYLNCSLGKQEKKRYFDIKTVQCYWEGNDSIMIMLIDNSNEVMNKRLLEINSFKDQLLATVTHDLKTPLNCMIQLLESSELEMRLEELKKNNHITLKNCHLLLNLIHDILDYCRIQSNNFTLKAEKFKIKDIVNEVFEMFSFSAQQKGLDLIMQCNVTDDRVYNDQRRLKQVLINFISNSMKFTETGHISIVIERAQRESDCYIAIKIIDTGCGIPLSIQDQLFKVFSTFDHNQGSNKHGVGLGLNICCQILSRIGKKEVDVKTKVGEGTIFTINIKKNISTEQSSAINEDVEVMPSWQLQNTEKKELQKLEQNFSRQTDEFYSQAPNNSKINIVIQQTPKSMQSLSSPISNQRLVQDETKIELLRGLHHGQTGADTSPNIKNNSITFIAILKRIWQKSQKAQLNILAVDDTVMNLFGLRRLFAVCENQIKFQIIEAHNGVQALQIFRDQYALGTLFDLIFMDVNMPLMGGIECIKNLRILMASTDYYYPVNSCKIVTNTAFSEKQDREECLKAGADFHVTKPLTYQSLCQSMQELQ